MTLHYITLHTYISTYIHACIHTYITYIHACMHACINADTTASRESRHGPRGRAARVLLLLLQLDHLRGHTILYCTILYCTILYYTILYYTIQYHTIPYHTILCYISPITCADIGVSEGGIAPRKNLWINYKSQSYKLNT